MADDGFVGRYEVVEPRRGNRSWPDDVKARIVAESHEPGVRVVDVARRHDDLFTRLANGHLAKDIHTLMPWAYAARIKASQ